MANPDPQAETRVVLDRLRSMGIRARPMEGGRCALASMRLQARAFPSLDGVLSIEQVVFSTVGRDRIKCLRPRALFQLPMIRILDCRDSTAIEARIRLAWRKRIAELRETRGWLESIGCEVQIAEDGATLGFPIEGENRRVRAGMIDRDRIILPGQGQLSGVALPRPEDRCLKIDRGTRSSVELEIAVSTRLEELFRIDRRLREERRRSALSRQPEGGREAETRRPARLLMVGARISRQTQCIESLRLRGYLVEVASDEREALAAFDSHSPELVLADMNMGRGDGTSLVLALRQVTGVEELPVILVDGSRRPRSREAARRVGAAGYLVYPVDVQRISERLSAMVNEPRRRRFTRYYRRLPIRVEGVENPSMVTCLGRGGMFVATDDDIEKNTLRHCRVSLPEVGGTLECETEVLYKRGSVGRESGGVGVRFNSFANSHENLLIEYLRGIEHSAGLPA